MPIISGQSGQKRITNKQSRLLLSGSWKSAWILEKGIFNGGERILAFGASRNKCSEEAETSKRPRGTTKEKSWKVKNKEEEGGISSDGDGSGMSLELVFCSFSSVCFSCRTCLMKDSKEENWEGESWEENRKAEERHDKDEGNKEERWEEKEDDEESVGSAVENTGGREEQSALRGTESEGERMRLFPVKWDEGEDGRVESMIKARSAKDKNRLH